uniref:NADH dehydrogenase subunit 6 n=1 Tax=Encyrtus rhodococcusiae TaxID=1914889 RepID=A0A7S5KMF4_9HYME|nr:NADH dehydrogenase subunit 6 [Encyrtus rhodococcusiae]QGA74524.1 NADH dehydrogenase subunit 6 [Encyrtus rhodococcusiae]QGA74535.1 NADH dehydrogenase subunit 6 [Encyrtus rhodococcusiae]QGA74551.1 NADH dehydrogenase subunit 6 [Encyrtus rhodococcusiae]QGA74562.1 NADH dehydrogenase subunit 6 [Encyrtus rhodococcusiae]
MIMKTSMNLILMFMITFSCMALMVTNSLIYTNNKTINPMIMGMFLMTFTMFTSMKLSQNSNQMWISMFTFLIMIGGMMILFLYFTSFVSNVTNEMNINYMNFYIPKILMTILISTLLYFNLTKFTWWTNNYTEIMNNYNLNKFNMLNFNSLITYMYMYNKNYSLIMVLIYLLSALTLIVKMIIKKKTTLRKIN